MDPALLFLAFIVLLGFVTSYEDIRLGKIRNLWVVSAFFLSMLLHLILFVSNQINVQYIVRISLFVLFSFIIGFFMFLMRLWSAGDAKLFTAYVSLFPLAFYRFASTGFWPLSILVNTILPVFILLLAQSFFRIKKQQFFFIAKKILSPKSFGMYLLVIFSVSWVVSLVFGYFGFQSNLILNIICIMAVMYVLKKVFPHEFVYLLLLASVLRVFLNYSYIMRFSFWKSFLLMTLAYALVIFFIRELSELYIKKANINYLKEGMQPVQFIIKHEGAYHRIDAFQKGLESVYGPKPEGLTRDDIRNVQNLHRSGRLHFNTLKVQQTVPFAPFMFAGVLLSLLVKGNVILFIRSLF